MTEYRVKEYQGRFYIQGKFEHVETPFSFWKTVLGIEQKEISKGFKWYEVNKKGGRCMNYRRLGIYDVPCGSFKTLDAAMDKIKIFQSGVKYHYPNVKSKAVTEPVLPTVK